MEIWKQNPYRIKKHLGYIFKYDTKLINIADDYIKNNLLDDFKTLIKYQIEKYLEQKKAHDQTPKLYIK